MADEKDFPKNCPACRYSYMEPDSDLICGHPQGGTFGRSLLRGRPTFCGEFTKFEQHPRRNADGTLKSDFPAIQRLSTPYFEKTTKFYVASRLGNQDQVRTLIAALQSRFGWEVTYDWTAHGSILKMDDVVSGRRAYSSLAREISALELEGVRAADLVFVLLPGGRGTHVEMGAAAALGKRIYIVYDQPDDLCGPGGYPCAFYHHHTVVQLGGTRSMEDAIERVGFLESAEMLSNEKGEPKK